MRMWGITPILMCSQHITGEHNEIHKHLPHLYQGRKIDGRYSGPPQIQLNALQSRHDELAMCLNHNSPLTVDADRIKANYPQYYDVAVDVGHNMLDLYARCPKCRAIMEKHGVRF